MKREKKNTYSLRDVINVSFLMLFVIGSIPPSYASAPSPVPAHAGTTGGVVGWWLWAGNSPYKWWLVGLGRCWSSIVVVGSVGVVVVVIVVPRPHHSSLAPHPSSIVPCPVLHCWLLVLTL
jgi:hypothetical protein